jgi:hypothetical protein
LVDALRSHYRVIDDEEMLKRAERQGLRAKRKDDLHEELRSVPLLVRHTTIYLETAAGVDGLPLIEERGLYRVPGDPARVHELLRVYQRWEVAQVCMHMYYAYVLCICIMHMYYAYVLCICIMHMCSAYVLCIWRVHLAS